MPPSLLATALVLQTYDGVSDDEAKRRADYRSAAGKWRWASKSRRAAVCQKYAAGVSGAADPARQDARHLPAESGGGQAARGVEEGESAEERQHIKLALDTTYILGRGAVKDTYNLLADGIVQVLRGLAELVTCELLEVAEELGCTRYVSGSSLKGQAEVDWTDPQARQRFLAEIVG